MNTKSTFVMEIVGPSGAGKSSVSKLLRAHGLNAGISVWGLPAAHLAISALRSLPSGLRTGFGQKNFKKEEFKQMIRLDALYQYLNRENSKTLILDEGPVFAISKMRTDRENYHSLFERWEEMTLDRWASTLDSIVLLDAPDDTLVKRMRSRAKQHRMKTKADEEIYGFLSRYRNAFEKTIGGLKQRKNVKILTFDTAQNSLEGIAREIAGFCETYESPTTKKVLGKDGEYIYGKTMC